VLSKPFVKSVYSLQTTHTSAPPTSRTIVSAAPQAPVAIEAL